MIDRELITILRQAADRAEEHEGVHWAYLIGGGKLVHSCCNQEDHTPACFVTRCRNRATALATIPVPDAEGVWLHSGETREVYRLEPAGGVLCYWDENLSTSDTWDTDEFVGHVPVARVSGPWTWISERLT